MAVNREEKKYIGIINIKVYVFMRKLSFLTLKLLQGTCLINDKYYIKNNIY